MNPFEARELVIRRIVAEVTKRSLRGIRPETRFRRDLELTGPQEDEISWRIEQVVGVSIPRLDWSDFSCVRDLIQWVEVEVQKGAPAE